MDIRKTIAAVLAAAMVLSMTACANNEKTNSGDYPDKPFGLGDEIPDPPKQVSMWDVLPEIPVTDASAFTYKYASELGGMVITDYLRESPKVRIPDKIEGEPVVDVNLRSCEKEITELVMPDSVKSFTLSSKIIKSLQYVNIPNDFPKLTDLGDYKNIQVIYYNGKTYDYEHIEWLYDAVNLGENGMVIEDGVLKYLSKDLTEAVIPNNVTVIGDSACGKCTGLTRVTIPDSVTKIDVKAFAECTSLTSIKIPNSVTEIGYKAFVGCASLTSITIPNSVTLIGDNVLAGCTSLTSIKIPNSVASIGKHAFYDCPSLTSITIPDSVTSIGGGAFQDCTSLSSITIPDSVTEISSEAFDGCTSLTNITIPDSVTNIERGAFDDCKNIQAAYKGKTYDYDHLDLLYDAAYFDESGVLIENGVLKDVSQNLTKVVIPDDVTEIGDHAFSGCTSLTSLTIPNSVTAIGSSAFSGCTSLTSITIPNSVTAIDHLAFRGCTSLKSITIPNSVTEIGSSAFDGCTNLTSVTYKGKSYDREHLDWLYDAVRLGKSGMLIENGVLKDVSKNMTELIIPDSVTEIDYKAFEGCTNLTSITTGKGITTINRFFSGLTNLKIVTISDSVTKISEEAFKDCTNLTSVTYKGKSYDREHFDLLYDAVNLGESGMLIEKGVLKDVSRNLTKLIIPDSVNEIGMGAFYGCTNLTSVTITGETMIVDPTCFWDCTSLTNINIIGENLYDPYYFSIDGLLCKKYYNGTKINLFICPKGKSGSITIPNSVTGIWAYSFFNCTSLTSVKIPDSVKSIGSGAFEGCTNIQATYKGITYDYEHIEELYRVINSN